MASLSARLGARRRYYKDKAEGRCVDCPNKATEGKTTCLDCRKRRKQ